MKGTGVKGSGALRLYGGLATLAAPALRLMVRVRLARGKEEPGRLAERRGIDPTPRPPGRLLWLHAASVGETASVLPLLPLLLDADPALLVLLTTGTVTSARLLAQRLDPAWSARVIHRFVPLDVPAWVGRFLDHWRPDAAAFVESELWPNLLAASRGRGIPMMLVNARMSARSFARWQRVPGIAQALLGGFSRIHAQDEAAAGRLRALGGSGVTVPGDLKQAAPPLPVDCAELVRLRALLDGRPVWLAASTHPGEETLIFRAHSVLAAAHPGLLTIIAPRHPERGPAIAAEAAPLPVTRRAAGALPPAGAGVWVADTLGEMGLWYRLAPVVFVGRSLVPPGGGQNPLEPARLGCAVAAGPHTGNFAGHVARLREAGALVTADDEAALAGFVTAMLTDPAARSGMAERATAVARDESDVIARTGAALLDLTRHAPAAISDDTPAHPG